MIIVRNTSVQHLCTSMTTDTIHSSTCSWFISPNLFFTSNQKLPSSLNITLFIIRSQSQIRYCLLASSQTELHSDQQHETVAYSQPSPLNETPEVLPEERLVRQRLDLLWPPSSPSLIQDSYLWTLQNVVINSQTRWCYAVIQLDTDSYCDNDSFAFSIF